MVVYDLQCPTGHAFEGWFRNADDFAEQQRDGRLLCPVCNQSGVQRLPTVSRINRGVPAPPASAAKPVADPVSQRDAMITAVHRFVEANFENVGRDFAAEARRIHRGEADERGIRGQATVDEVRALGEEGIGALPLPLSATERKKLN